MNITIECQGFSMSDAINGHARSQVREALRYYADSIDTFDLYLRDHAGPNDPKEYSALARVKLRGMPDIAVEALGCDLYLTVRHAARRAQRAVARSLRRQRHADSATVQRLPRATPNDEATQDTQATTRRTAKNR